MKILAINGSHRKGKNTSEMLKLVLEEASASGAQTELVELVDFNIKPCVSCNKCLRRTTCSITDDDTAQLLEKMVAADAIVLGSPVYFGNVSGLTKIFIDRTRPLHMVKNLLHGKIGAAVTIAGMRNEGQEITLQIMEAFLKCQGLLVIDARDPESDVGPRTMGTLFAGLKDGKTVWKRGVLEDEAAVLACRQLGRNIVAALK